MSNSKGKRVQSRSFKERVHAVVRSIPKGETLSYKDVAEFAGSPGAFRAVGTLLSKNYDKSIPCHRVVRSDGKPGGYNRGGWQKKTSLLKKEKNKIA